jgi:molybdate transport system substrate-binding protein
VAAALAAALAAGCGKPGAPSASGGVRASSGNAAVSGKLMVFVPCGIAGPYGEIKDLFLAKYPGVQVSQDVRNVDVQLRAILDGKDTPDVWMSLGDREVAQLTEKGKVDGEPTTYAVNSIALMVQQGNPHNIESLADLTAPGIKTIAIPTESNSSGYYVKQALENAGIWDQIQTRVWVTPEPSAVKAQLQEGKADVGVVYYPCTRESKLGSQPNDPEAMPGKVQLLGELPEDVAAKIPSQAAVIKGAANVPAARAWLEFLTTDQVQDIWEKWAFGRAKERPGGPKTTLYLYCGAGIRPFMEPAVEAFQKQHPNVRIDVGYAGSGCLLSQLAFAKKGDLYMPGEDYYLAQARDRQFIGEERLVGYFEPVILVRKGNPKGVRGLEDLAKPGLRVGVGEPDSCAVGRAAAAILEKAGLSKQVEPNIRARAGNVPELGNAVKLKSLDAVIVWNITAAQYPNDCEAVPLAAGTYEPSAIPVGLLKFAAHETEARQFMEFLLSPEGQGLAADAGMTPAEKAAA